MSDAIFAGTPSQQQLHQHHVQQALHQQQQQQQMAQSQSHSDQSAEGAAPPVPQIRITSAHRSAKASATPLPQLRNPPEPYVNEFQPKTPERGDIDIDATANPADGGVDATYMEAAGQFHSQGPMPPEAIHFHQTPSGAFTQGPFTPRAHQYLDPNMQHLIQDPALMQHQQLQQQQLQQQLLQQQQQQQMFNPLPPLLTPTHGMGLAPPRSGGGAPAFGGAGRGRGRMASAAPAWFQDPMHTILEEEKERRREIKLLKNREAAREGREKKRRYQMLLEARVSILETQNRALIEELKALKFLFCKPSSVMQQRHDPQLQQHQAQPHHLSLQEQQQQQQQHQQQQMHYETQQVVV